jgi:hypothetical protein
MTLLKIVRVLSLTGAVYGALGFIYIAGNAWFHPRTLSMQLTHFLPYPREDTFGAFCFGISLIGFFAYQLIKDK